eukprot:2198391-Amphidinium_carterae.1
MASGRNLEAEYAEQQERVDQDDDPDAPADESEQPEDDPNAASMKGKGSSKGRGKDGRVKVRVVVDHLLVDELLHLFPSVSLFRGLPAQRLMMFTLR